MTVRSGRLSCPPRYWTEDISCRFTQADQRQVGEKRPVGGADSGHHSPLHQCGDGGLAARDLFLSHSNISNPKPDSVSSLHRGSRVLREEKL